MIQVGDENPENTEVISLAVEALEEAEVKPPESQEVKMDEEEIEKDQNEGNFRF